MPLKRNTTLQYAVKINNGLQFGAGVIIGPDTVLTAKHVVSDAKCNLFTSGLVVTTTDGRTFMQDSTWKIQTRKRDDGNLQDVAIVTIPHLGGDTLAFGTPVIGDECWCIGNPGNFDLGVTVGNVHSLNPKWHSSGDPTYCVILDVLPGDSGAGVFAYDDAGNIVLIGIVDGSQMQTFAGGHGIVQVSNKHIFTEPPWNGK